MRKIILIVQTSFDGFVAGPNGEFDHFIGGDENLGFVCRLIDEGDAILLGRKSYELLNTHWPGKAKNAGATMNEIKYSNWYNSSAKIVLTRTLKETGIENGTAIHNNLAVEIEKLKQQLGKAIFIFGSPTAVHSLLELDLIDEICLILHPVIFGEGIPFLKSSKKIRKLNLLTTEQLSSGTIGLRYAVE
jgi:dihydrofolate reductase